MLIKEPEPFPSKAAKEISKKQPIRWSWRLLREVMRLQPSNKYVIQLLRSLVVSVIALIADFGLLVILKEKFGAHYLLAAALSFSLGVVVSYMLSVKWVFATRRLDSYHKEFIIFVIICTVGLALNLAIIALAVSWLEFDYRLAKAISAMLVFFWNFIAKKIILY